MADGKSEVRIVAYDLAKGAPSVLLTAPYKPAHDFMSLSLTHEGELVLTAGMDGAYTSWLIEAKPNGVPAFIGRLDREGAPLDAPVMGVLGPAIPVLDANGDVRMDSLDPREFEQGAPCTEL